MGAVAQRLDQGRISFERNSDATLVAHLSGPWHLQRDLPPISLLLSELGSRPEHQAARVRDRRSLRIGTAG